MQIKYKQVKSIREFIDAIRLRVDVFIKEQGFAPGWEPDEDDKKAQHFIALVGGKVVATARYREISKGDFKIERMATRKDFRGSGVGSGLLKFIVKKIMKSKPKRIWAKSQVLSQKFYEKNGWNTVSEPYQMHGIGHVDMEYKV